MVLRKISFYATDFENIFLVNILDLLTNAAQMGAAATCCNVCPKIFNFYYYKY